MSDLSLPPPKPPRPPTLIGPDRWWNPFSPSWPTTALGRAAADLARQKTAQVASEIEDATGKIAEAIPGIDPIVAAEAIVGRPTWGYYVPTVGAVVAASAVAVAAAMVYRRSKRKGRR
jgi:hypothetical protein